MEAYHDEEGHVIDVHMAQDFGLICVENKSLQNEVALREYYRNRMSQQSDDKALSLFYTTKYNEKVERVDKIVQKLWARYVRENDLTPVSNEYVTS